MQGFSPLTGNDVATATATATWQQQVQGFGPLTGNNGDDNGEGFGPLTGSSDGDNNDEGFGPLRQ